MDITTAAAPTGFMAWFTQYGQVMYIFVQMAFWVLVGVAAAFAAAKYSQWVNFATGKSSRKLPAEAETPKAGRAGMTDTLEADE
ncbi:MAG: hypothetical protein ACYC1X_00825 [Coriobacteriia bacterium]